MGFESHIATDIIMVSRCLKNASHNKRAMRVFIVKSGSEVLLARPGFNWSSRNGLKEHTLRQAYMFEREEVIIDPGGRLSDRTLLSKPLVKALRAEGKYGFSLPEAESDQYGDRYAGWVLVVDSSLVRVK